MIVAEGVPMCYNVSSQRAIATLPPEEGGLVIPSFELVLSVGVETRIILLGGWREGGVAVHKVVQFVELVK